jgi:hypothetical protein
MISTRSDISCQDIKIKCFGCAGGLGLSYLGASALGKALISYNSSCTSCIEKVSMALLDKEQAEEFFTAEKWAVVMEKITTPPTVKINIPSVEIFDILSREIPTMRISDLESANILEADISADTVTNAPLEQLNEQPTEQPFDLNEEQSTEQPISSKDSSDGALDTLASLAGGLEGKNDLHIIHICTFSLKTKHNPQMLCSSIGPK